MIKIFAHIILLVLLSTVVIAQDSLLKKKNKFPQIIEINTGYGMLTKHRSTMDYFITENSEGLNQFVGEKGEGQPYTSNPQGVLCIRME